MSECVMSIYGITRLLASRELGPAQIVPTLDAFASEVGERCARFDALFATLADDVSAHPELREAVELVRREGARVSQAIVATFAADHRLGARDRLALEADAPRIGGELQGLQKLVELLLAATDPQPTPLRLFDLLGGVWRPRPAFVERQLEVMLACASPVLEGEPRVVSAMVEVALRHATEPPFVSIEGTSPAQIVIAKRAAIGMDTIERAYVSLAPALAIEPAVLAAVGRHLGTALRIDADGASISVAA